MTTLVQSAPGVAAVPSIAEPDRPVVLARVPSGFDALVLADIARLRARRGAPGRVSVLHVARDEQQLSGLLDALGFFAPDVEAIGMPAWDCLPYDRVGPNPNVESRRLEAFARLAERARQDNPPPAVLVTTASSILQRVPAREAVEARSWRAGVGATIDVDGLIAFLDANGYERAGTVVEPGEFAVRGGIIDIYPAGAALPLRLDLFGRTLESVRDFDPETQRTVSQQRGVSLIPVSEVVLDSAAIASFRQGYVAAFGAVTSADPLYEAVSAGRRYRGMEHWLPLFHGRLETLTEIGDGALLTLDHLAPQSVRERFDQIEDHYRNRQQAPATSGLGAPPYNPLPPAALYLDRDEWSAVIGAPHLLVSPFEEAESSGPEGAAVVDLGGRPGRDFGPERAAQSATVFDASVAHIRSLHDAGKRVIVAAASDGARDRLATLLADHGLADQRPVAGYGETLVLPAGVTGLATLALEHGFDAPDLAVVAEQDILGERLLRGRRRTRRAEEFLTEASSLSPGDLVVHVDHGIGRFVGLKTVDAAGAPHDCLEIHYHGGDKLYLPVENIEILSRYGHDEDGVALDRLGGAGWQARKARAKERIREIADQLIKVAAARELRPGIAMAADPALYAEFCARFPFEETDDQESSIAAVLGDLASGRPMDRLVCGDVGFGKTEVALRSAFVAAMAGHQTAVVVPTTLLARQHFQTFTDRFRGFPVRIGRLSRLVGTKEAVETRRLVAEGAVDIVIGTHALLSKSMAFADLGLLVIDEEQHFGVAHKERLKELRTDVHVLTLTATPIPRTLQLALSGVRDLSVIATPPVDRLAVRTFISPFDPVVVREALLRELYRGGQTFFVCPRIKDLAPAAEFLAGHVPEVKVVQAHGQMPARHLDDVMNAFYDGRYDVLLSTAIVESGLDIPSANTLIVLRADRFGLSQLYQLRGRVGRSKTRAYALFTVPGDRMLTEGAEKRLKVLQSLDSLGAGFTLASHDLDIRGAGNLLGEEQSGHIREVGFELYQTMLEEAVASLRAGPGEEAGEEQWSPTITVGAAVLLPDSYIPDLHLRLGLYRRLSAVATPADLDAFAAELVDRFGPLPEEVGQLIRVVAIKLHCRAAGIARLDAGPKGAVVGFRNDRFADPEALIGWIGEMAPLAKVRPDHKLVIRRSWAEIGERLKGAEALARQIAGLAGEGAGQFA